MKVLPKRDNILIRIDEPEEKSAGGIIIPDQAKRRRETARVVAVGPGVWRDGVVVPPDVKEGQRVIFNVYDPVPVELNGETLHMIDFNAVLAVIEG